MSAPTLTDFLLARIAEDEAVARAFVLEGPWQAWALTDYSGPTRDDEYAQLSIGAARVLADCEAKRRIVEREGKRLHEEWRRRSDEHRQTFEEWFTKPYGETLRDLALPYADHEDYRAEWKP